MKKRNTSEKNKPYAPEFSPWEVVFVFFAILSITVNFSDYAERFFHEKPRENEIRFSAGNRELGAPFEMPTVTLYAFPDRVCAIEEYGAIGDGTTPNTFAINTAIADCARQGGGTVSVPAGKWLTGPIRLKNDIRLDLAEGATILGSTDFDDYLPVVFSRYEGMEYYNYSPLIYANGVRNAAVTGSGTIDGNGEAWWSWRDRSRDAAERLYQMADFGIPVSDRIFGTEADALRPSLVGFVGSSSVSVEGVTIRNGPMWTLHFLYSDSILVKNVTIDTEGPNNDGIVVDSSRNVIIDSSTLDTGDDAIAIKSGLDRDGQRVGKPSENVVVRNCRIGRGNGGVVIGSEMSADVRNVSVSDCVFDGTKRGIRVKSLPGRSGIVENFFVEHVGMKDIEGEAILLNMVYDSKSVIDPTAQNPPTFRNFSFHDIDIDGAGTALSLVGLPNGPISGLSFENIRSLSTIGIEMSDTEKTGFHDIDVRASKRPLIRMSDSRDIVFGALGHVPSYRPFVVIDGSRTENISFEKGYPDRAIRLGKDVRKETVSY